MMAVPHFARYNRNPPAPPPAAPVPAGVTPALRPAPPPATSVVWIREKDAILSSHDPRPVSP